MGFDQLTALYSYYKVYRVRVKGRICPVGTNVGMYTLLVNSNLTLVTDVPRAREQPESKQMMLPTATAGLGPSVDWTFDLWKMEGQSKAQYAADDLVGALVGSNPSNPIVMHNLISNPTGSVAPDASTFLQFTLYFDCELYHPNFLASS